MLNIAWIFLLGVGCFVGIANGNADKIGNTLIESASGAIQFSMGIIGVVALWSGLMNILKEAGFIEGLGKFLYPLLGIFFPEIKHDNIARENLVSNVAANFLGLGNAATPYGIKTVKALQRHSNDKYVASRSVRLFLVSNSAALQLLPTTIIAMRAEAGSLAPAAILLPVWVISFASFAVAIISFYLFELLSGRIKGGKL